MTGAHANRLGQPSFQPAPPPTTLPDVMAPAETALVYRAGPPLAAPVAAPEPADAVIALLQQVVLMRGVNNQVRKALSWLVMNADLAEPDADDDGPNVKAAKAENRAEIVGQALGHLRPDARPQPRERRRARSGRGGRGHRRKPEPEPAAAG